MDFKSLLQSMDNISENTVHKAGPGGYGNRHGSETQTDQYGKPIGKVSLASLAPKDDKPKSRGRPVDPDKPKTGKDDPKNKKVGDLFGRTTGDVPKGKKGTKVTKMADADKEEKKAEKKSLKDWIEASEANQLNEEGQITVKPMPGASQIIGGDGKPMGTADAQTANTIKAAAEKGTLNFTGDDEQMNEKSDKPVKTDSSEKGKYKGKSKSELLKAFKHLKKTGPHEKDSKQYGNMKELAVAIRAKGDLGKEQEKAVGESEDGAPRQPAVQIINDYDEVVAEFDQIPPRLKSALQGSDFGAVQWLADLARKDSDLDMSTLEKMVFSNGHVIEVQQYLDELDESIEESGLQAWLGKKKYGPGFEKLQDAGRKGASEKTKQNIRAEYSDKEEPVKEGGYNPDRDAEKEWDRYAQGDRDFQNQERNAGEEPNQPRYPRTSDRMRQAEEKEDPPFDGPYKKPGDNKDQFGNTVKNPARHAARKGMAAAIAKAKKAGASEETMQDTRDEHDRYANKDQKKKVDEARIMEESEYTYEKIGKTLSQENPTLASDSDEFANAVYNEMIQMGMTPRSAYHKLNYDEDFLGEVATAYHYYVKHNTVDEGEFTQHYMDANKPSSIRQRAELAQVPKQHTPFSVDPINATTDRVGSFLKNLGQPKKTFEGKNMKDIQLESWEKELNSLLNLNEGITVSSSTGQQGSPDSVSVNATDGDAQQLLQVLRSAGVGVFGGDQERSDYGAPMNSQEPTGAGSEPEMSPAVVGDGDDMMALIKKMSGIQDSGEPEGIASSDYESEEGSDDNHQAQHGSDNHDHEEEHSDKEETDEGSEWTEKLKNTPKGGKFTIGGKEYTDTSSLEEQGHDHEDHGTCNECGMYEARCVCEPGEEQVEEGQLDEISDQLAYNVNQARAEKHFAAKDKADAAHQLWAKGEGNMLQSQAASTTAQAARDARSKLSRNTELQKSRGYRLGKQMYEPATNQHRTAPQSMGTADMGLTRMKTPAQQMNHNYEESIEEDYANEAGHEEMAQLKHLLSMGNDMHKEKRSQAVGNPTQVTFETKLLKDSTSLLQDFKKLSGIK